MRAPLPCRRKKLFVTQEPGFNLAQQVISDSYEKATISSQLLFGRARVIFTAQNEALESYLRPGTDPMDIMRITRSARAIVPIATKTFRWFVLFAIIATAADAEVYLVTRSIDVIVHSTANAVWVVVSEYHRRTTYIHVR